MVLINVTVVLEPRSTVLLSWEILGVHNPQESFQSLFDRRIKPKISKDGTQDVTVEKCYVGHAKNSLDVTDPALLIHEVVSSFGQYVKFQVRVGICTSDMEYQVCSGCRVQNAFDVIMQAQKDQSLPTFPERVPVRTKKDDLFNAIIDLLEQMNLTLTRNEANAGGKQLVKVLCNTLWYIDGRHDTFSARSFNIPDVFAQFQGFNRPELSKHRKREHRNLNADELRGLSSDLFAVLLNPFLRRSSWGMLQVHIEILAQSLASYADYLGEKNKHMKIHHSTSTP